MKPLMFNVWRPDRVFWNEQALVVAKNVTPGVKGFRPIKKFESDSAALDARVRGAMSFRLADGTRTTVAGTYAFLYKYENADNTWTDISDATYGGDVASGIWSMVSFGTNAIMTNLNDPVKTYDASTAPATVSDLGGSPPKAQHVFVVKDHIVLAHLSGEESAMHWSAINDSTGWTVGTNMSDKQTFPEGGPITNGFGGEYGIIFQQYRIRRMTYAPGAPEIFQISTIDDTRGCIANRAAVQLGRVVFFLSNDGFYVLAGNEVKPIGNEKVDNWFFDDVMTGQVARTIAGIDVQNKLVMWAYVSSAATANSIDEAACDKVIIYNWTTGEWSHAEFPVTSFLDAVIDNFTLEDLDAIADLDSLTQSLDSGAWNMDGVSSQLAIFDDSFKYGYLSGGAMEASFQMNNIQLASPHRQLINGVYPLIDAADMKVRLRVRERLADTGTWLSYVQIENTGHCPQHSSGRLHDVELVVAEDDPWQHGTGFVPDAQMDGRI